LIFVIGIGHKARVGKTSLAITLQAVLQARGAFVHSVSFADPLKSIYRIHSNQYQGKDGDKLQFLAEQQKTLYGEGIFARDLVARINDHYEAVKTVAGDDPQVIYIIPDLRHKVELDELVKFENHILVRVTRENPPEPDRNPNHRSETELDFAGWEDYEVSAGNMEELKVAGLQLANAIFGEETPSE
jgi:hypothetical protein